MNHIIHVKKGSDFGAPFVCETKAGESMILTHSSGTFEALTRP